MSETPAPMPGRPEFTDRDLRGARFVRCDLSGAVLRAVDVSGADIDAPWLGEPGGVLIVNGVDVAPFVEAELDRRFPGRSQRRAGDPAGLRAAWQRVQEAWDSALARAASMPADAVEASVDGEWSFAQTLRHLVMATDTWLRGAIVGIDRPYHPLGQPNAEYATDGYDLSVFAAERPAYGEVLAARADRVGMVTDYLDRVTPEELATLHPHPWAPAYQETTLSCLHTILGEEWEHLRFALRDLDILAAGGAA